MSSFINIDGSLMEGGGQILRMSVVFSALLKKPVRIFNIRGKRSNPGLRAQHLMGLKLVRDLCGGVLEGAELNSTEISFTPGYNFAGKELTYDTKTAGSVVLLLQVALPCLLFGPSGSKSTLTLKGGTNCEMAPQIDYTMRIFKPMVEKFGAFFDCRILQRGYFPKGGGSIRVECEGISGCLKNVDMTSRPVPESLSGYAFTAGGLPPKIQYGLVEPVTKSMRETFSNVRVKIDRVHEPPDVALGTCAGIVVWSNLSTGCIVGADALLKRGERGEDAGSRCAAELMKILSLRVNVDSYMQDQLIVFMALAEGESSVLCGPITLHTETAIYIAELLSDIQ